MKYHIHIQPNGWTQLFKGHQQWEQQVIIHDFGDGQRLVVELRRACADGCSPIVHGACLEEHIGAAVAAPGWKPIRRVRRRDLVLIDAG